MIGLSGEPHAVTQALPRTWRAQRCARNRDRHRSIIGVTKGVALNTDRSELFLSFSPGISLGFLFGVTRAKLSEGN